MTRQNAKMIAQLGSLPGLNQGASPGERRAARLWRETDDLFSSRDEAITLIRKAMLAVHPDKQSEELRGVATALQRVLNSVLGELRE